MSMAGFKNKCARCGKVFAEDDKAVVTAVVGVKTGGFSLEHIPSGRKIPKEAKLKIRFYSGSKRKLVHLSCFMEADGEGL